MNGHGRRASGWARRRAVGGGGVLALLLASAAGCSAAPTPTPPSTPPSASPAAPNVTDLSVTARDLSLDGYTTTYQRVGNRSGSEQFPAIARVAPGTLGVSARCSGTGSITVEVGGTITFVVHCGDPAGGNVDYADATARTGVRAQVISHTAGQWAFGLAWRLGTGEPPQDPASPPTGG